MKWFVSTAYRKKGSVTFLQMVIACKFADIFVSPTGLWHAFALVTSIMFVLISDLCQKEQQETTVPSKTIGTARPISLFLLDTENIWV